jgi:plastocyanin
LGRAFAAGLAALALAAAGTGCGSSGDKGKTPSGEVTVADFSFSPEATTVSIGEAVTWTNEGQVDHTVKGPGFFSTKALGNGQKFSHRFSRAGRFDYVCTLHPGQMRGTVVVRG